MLLLLAIAAVLPPKHSEYSVVSLTKFTTRAASEDACKDIDSCRRLFDIVWGCLATVFACVWVSVHPNVPPPKPARPPKGVPIWQRVKWRLIDSHGALRSRLKLMLVGLLAPELIAGFAGRQLGIAWQISKKYKVSLTHGFFICMGGFVDGAGHPIVTCAQIDPEKDETEEREADESNDLPSATNESADLLPHSPTKPSETKTLQAIRRTTEDAIEDKSKGDAFSKGIAFFQGLWFVLSELRRYNPIVGNRLTFKP
ncbi:hypothetical protein C8F01DRAFT_1370770 [Mycena amicta]|nr:hypothetical protein C8F01DRAFT_1370770 [Mycena amicta]